MFKLVKIAFLVLAFGAIAIPSLAADDTAPKGSAAVPAAGSRPRRTSRSVPDWPSSALDFRSWAPESASAGSAARLAKALPGSPKWRRPCRRR